MIPFTERSHTYHDYAPEIVNRIAEVEEMQVGKSWDELKQLHDIPEVERYYPENGEAVDVQDFIPEGDYDEKEAVGLYLPMANGLFPHMQLRAATLHAAMPDKRLVVFGSPSIGDYNAGHVSKDDTKLISKENDLRPLIDPSLQYMNEEGVENALLFGYSAGADLSTTAAMHADKYDMSVARLGAAEPASVAERSKKLPVIGSLIGMASLGLAFNSTATHMRPYMDSSGLDGLNEAFDKFAVKDMDYNKSLARRTNIALTKALTRATFEGRMDEALKAQDEMVATIIWGSESELAIDSLMVALTGRLAEKHGSGRVKTERLFGHYHAMAEDIHNHAAMAMTALQPAA